MKFNLQVPGQRLFGCHTDLYVFASNQSPLTLPQAISDHLYSEALEEIMILLTWLIDARL